MWMTAVSLTAAWLWRSGALTRIGPVSFGAVGLPAILIVTVLCRSGGALFLLLLGLCILWTCARLDSRWPLCLLLLIGPIYYALRVPNIWTGENLVSTIQSFDPTRAQSLGYRFWCENMLIGRALEQPFWGWGGWGGNRVIGPDGRDKAVTDGIWIIYLGYYGCYGLTCWTLSLLLAPTLFVKRFRVSEWKSPTIGPAAVLATLLGLYMIDCLLNGFINIVYVVAAGGLMGLTPAVCRRQSTFFTRVSSDRGAEYGVLREDHDGAVNELDVEPLEPDAGGSQVLALPQALLAHRYQELARTLKAQGLAAEARTAWFHALDLLTQLVSGHPDLTQLKKRRWTCINDLAWFLANEPDPAVRDPELAVRLAMEATQADPEVGAYWNTLGVACCRAGRPAEAITALNRSVALTGGGTGFDFVFLHLAHSSLGHDDEAQVWKMQTDTWLSHNQRQRQELARLSEQAF